MSVVIVDSSTLDVNSIQELPPIYRQWIYCGLDSCVTAEVKNKLEPEINVDLCAQDTLEFTWSEIPAIFDMVTRGIRIDQTRKMILLSEVRHKNKELEAFFDSLCLAACEKTFNPRSPSQLHQLFYEELQIKPIVKKVRGEHKVSMDRDTLEKIQVYFYAKPFARTILAIRDLGKIADVLRSGVDDDDRIRVSFNPVGTETGRWSSSKNVFGGGLNFQNVTDSMREIFISDEGCKLCNIDLEQAESRAVAYLAQDPAYIEACESDDLHTGVARMVWADLQWSNDSRENRAIADESYYRHFSRRDISKRLGHASNYMGSAWQLARVLKLEKSTVEDFQARYFGAFPGIQRWHKEVQVQLMSQGFLITPFNRKRQFFSRLWDESTLKEAVAHLPQSTVVDYINRILVEIYTKLDLPDRGIQLLGQGHDAIIFQYPEHNPDLVANVQDIFSRMSVDINGARLHIPFETTAGFNWRKRKSNSVNPSGLAPFGSVEERAQTRPTYSLLNALI